MINHYQTNYLHIYSVYYITVVLLSPTLTLEHSLWLDGLHTIQESENELLPRRSLVMAGSHIAFPQINYMLLL